MVKINKQEPSPAAFKTAWRTMLLGKAALLQGLFDAVHMLRRVQSRLQRMSSNQDQEYDDRNTPQIGTASLERDHDPASFSADIEPSKLLRGAVSNSNGPVRHNVLPG